MGVPPAPGVARACFSAGRERFGPGDDKIWANSGIGTGSVGRGEMVPAGLIPAPVVSAINELLDKLGYRAVDEGWGTPGVPSDPRLPETVIPANQAAADGRIAGALAATDASGRALSGGVEQRLRAGVDRVDGPFASRWDAAAAEKFLAVLRTTEGGGNETWWLVDLATRVVTRDDPEHRRRAVEHRGFAAGLGGGDLGPPHPACRAAQVRPALLRRRLSDAHGSPVIVLTYLHSGAERLRDLLARHPGLACTSGTGILPLCAQAAEAWRSADYHASTRLSPLAVNSTRTLASAIIIALLARAGAQRWCETATADPATAETFLQLYPGKRVLCLHRGCVDVVRAALHNSTWGVAGPAIAPFTASYPGSAVAALTAYWAARTAYAVLPGPGTTDPDPANRLTVSGQRPAAPASRPLPRAAASEAAPCRSRPAAGSARLPAARTGRMTMTASADAKAARRTLWRHGRQPDQ